jgi:CubicO group peptidase (beta-lactamase class C family)
MIGAVPATKILSPTRIARQYPMIDSYGESDEMRCRSTWVVSRLVDALAAIDRWGARRAAAGVVRAGEVVASHGSLDERFRWASITKLLTAGAILVAAEEGVLDLDEPAGPPGSTVRHLLAHASGLPFEGPVPIARPGARRIYSNTGYELLGDFLAERSGMPFDRYLAGAVLGPAGIESVRLEGTPAAGAIGSLAALLALARELLAPRFVAAETLAEATEVAFPGLVGVLPGFGRQDPCDWGLGFELRDAKPAHWTGTRTSPSTFGHFGGAGTFLWVDPTLGVALGCLTDREFDDWALTAWPALSDAVVDSLA